MFCRLRLQVPPALVCMLGEVAEDLLLFLHGAARAPAPRDPLGADTLRRVPKLFGGEGHFSWPCSLRMDLGRASSAGQDAAGLAAAQNSFALVTDDFDAFMEELFGYLRLWVALLTVPGLGCVLDIATVAVQVLMFRICEHVPGETPTPGRVTAILRSARARMGFEGKRWPRWLRGSAEVCR